MKRERQLYNKKKKRKTKNKEGMKKNIKINRNEKE